MKYKPNINQVIYWMNDGKRVFAAGILVAQSRRLCARDDFAQQIKWIVKI